MKHLAMATAMLAMTGMAALANFDPAATRNEQLTGAVATAPGTETPVLVAQRRFYRYGARRCMENLGYGRHGTYGCG